MADLPREELIRHAEIVLRSCAECGTEAEVHFKFTCEKCGTRCTLVEPNNLFEKGECHQCGHTTVITKGGYALHMTLGGKTIKKESL
jgi:hypothetical protein